MNNNENIVVCNICKKPIRLKELFIFPELRIVSHQICEYKNKHTLERIIWAFTVAFNSLSFRYYLALIGGLFSIFMILLFWFAQYENGLNDFILYNLIFSFLTILLNAWNFVFVLKIMRIYETNVRKTISKRFRAVKY